MTNREQIHLLLAKVGMKIMLEEIIKALDRWLAGHSEDYLIQLKTDLQTALSNYEARYQDK